MEEINVKVVKINGKIIFEQNMPINIYVNQICNELNKLKLYYDRNFELIYKNKKISPLQKICDITSSTSIIFDIVLYFDMLTINNDPFNESQIAINTDGKIIDLEKNSYSILSYLNPLYNLNGLQNMLNLNFNCLTIIKICCTAYYAVILFENGTAIIFSIRSNQIIETYNNVTKINKTYMSIGLIINNNKLIIYERSGEIFENDQLNNLDYKYMYSNYIYFFIICNNFILIVNDNYNNQMLMVTKYEINNIVKIYNFNNERVIAAITEDSSLILFELSSDNNKLSINPIDDINKKSIKIKKILYMRNTFITITFNDSLFIWGEDNKLLELFKLLKKELIEINDIVVTLEYIGILNSNNDIIIISVINKSYNIYKSSDLNYKYNKIISTILGIFVLTDDNKIYEILCKPKKYDFIEILTDIKAIYSNNKNILALSNDNIVYVYYSIRSKTSSIFLYYKEQILDFKSVKINNYAFIIIRKNTNDLVEIKYKVEINTLLNVVKFIQI